MTPILFYGVPSGCSFGSIVALEWLGAPYRLCRVRMPEDVSGPGYRRLNPVGETPTLLTAEGAALSESMAILNHLGARAIDAGLGFPQRSPGFDRLNQMLGFLNTSFFGAFSPLWYALEHAVDGAARQALVDYGRAAVARAHADLERMLGDGPWLLGGHRTLADAYFVGIARWTGYHAVVDRADYPGLQRLYQRLEADPAVAFAHAVEAGRPAGGGPGFQGEVGLDEALALAAAPAG
ncbi:glutathione S-transferase family protein [Luteimonas sp. RD2P54]|uniref:Glutathione S-transferase family protein n=1 Tax=Luteimonas endophytica TaxID=3042023 RepID=A0ABT6JA52_9GAMM|nr:glutathione S-transferase family protein [Luteimonas endophytica]MDH5823712.1 glutathione S-transferase family protein [Luteimonas endophytica]